MSSTKMKYNYTDNPIKKKKNKAKDREMEEQISMLKANGEIRKKQKIPCLPSQ